MRQANVQHGCHAEPASHGPPSRPRHRLAAGLPGGRPARSFTVAARTLGWTQSAVSRQISSLEAALGGAPLFDRLPAGGTADGGRAGARAVRETVAGALHGAARELAALREAAGGRLRFGAFPTADAALVPHALGAFRTRHPGVRVTREEGLTPSLLDRLTGGGWISRSSPRRAAHRCRRTNCAICSTSRCTSPSRPDIPWWARAPGRCGSGDSPTPTGSPGARAPRARFSTRLCGRASGRGSRMSSASGPPSRATSPRGSA